MDLSPQTKFLIVMFMMLGIWVSESMSRSSINEDAVVAEKHKRWMTHHSRVYRDNAEKEKRFQIFKTNLEYIENFNNQSNKTYKLGLNQFSDLTTEEFSSGYTGFKMPTSNFPTANYTTLEMQDEIPETIDWREKGVVTPVKNQGRCGCCWAFSAVTAIEGIMGNGVSLSAQQLLDCVDGDNGCKGGFMSTAFEYIIQNQGIASEEDYPYQEMQGNCDTQKSTTSAAQITSYQNVTANEQALQIAVANQPVSVGLYASPNFQHYSSGVFSGDDCGTHLNHAVAIVGYGTTAEDGTKYWIIKNQWGESWGMGGYMMIQREVEGITDGVCGIATAASYPTKD